ncbi:MAG: helix-turn-helix domain-containing protein [Acidobacteriota bacterium]|nr:helix-turn-helix domain-containing protein [Acidobacteriota bacterium]
MDQTKPLDEIRIVDENLKGGFVQLPRLVLRAKNLSVKAKLIYGMLLDYAWHDDHVFPGQDRMADDLDVSLDSVQRALQELRVCHLIDYKRQGLNLPNIYFILSLGENPYLHSERNGSRKLRFPETAKTTRPETANSGSNYTKSSIRKEEYLSDSQKRTRSHQKESTQTVSQRITPPFDASLSGENAADDAFVRTTTGMESIGQNLQQRFAAIATEKAPSDLRQQGRPRRKPVSLSDDEYESLIMTVKDYARKNSSAEELKSHITTACKIIEQSQCSYGTFYSACIEAGRRTEERRMKGNLGKPMAYWFTCLKTELGLLPPPSTPILSS